MIKVNNKNKTDPKFSESVVFSPIQGSNSGPTKATNPNIREDSSQPMEPALTKGIYTQHQAYI